MLCPSRMFETTGLKTKTRVFKIVLILIAAVSVVFGIGKWQSNKSLGIAPPSTPKLDLYRNTGISAAALESSRKEPLPAMEAQKTALSLARKVLKSREDLRNLEKILEKGGPNNLVVQAKKTLLELRIRSDNYEAEAEAIQKRMDAIEILLVAVQSGPEPIKQESIRAILSVLSTPPVATKNSAGKVNSILGRKADIADRVELYRILKFLDPKLVAELEHSVANSDLQRIYGLAKAIDADISKNIKEKSI